MKPLTVLPLTIAALLPSIVPMSLTVMTTALLTASPAYSDGGHSRDQHGACNTTARVLKRACYYEARDDFLTEVAVCLNLGDSSEYAGCVADARSDRRDNNEECRDVKEAREDLCDEVGNGPYAPGFGEDFADSFVDPLDIGGNVTPHAFFPLVQGNRWVYESSFLDDEGEEVTETITVTVTNKIKIIQGIPCLVVNDLVEEDGEKIEDTDDWYAQDLSGNLWYCGEIAENFETFEDDEPADAELVDIEGSWKSGRDGAKAGILLPAVPLSGMFIRQEVSWGDAEDVIEVIGTTGTETSPAASCDGDCLVTRDFTPLEPDVEEYKFYAPNVGLIVELDPETGDKVELVDVDLN